MRNIVGDAYAIFRDGDAICVTTNGEVMKNGKAVMGAGNAKFVRDTFPGIDLKLANYLGRFGNRVFDLGRFEYQGRQLNIVSFPTKHEWKNNSVVELISKSANELSELLKKRQFGTVYLPVPGCSNGKLKWSEVSPALSILGENVVAFTTKSWIYRS
jgi:hypothetical protein